MNLRDHNFALVQQLSAQHWNAVESVMEDRDTGDQWVQLAHTLRRLVAWKSVATAATLRRRALGKGLTLPASMSLSDLFKQNDWTQPLVTHILKHVNDRVDAIIEHERVNAELQQDELSPEIAHKRLKVLCRNLFGEVDESSEQLLMADAGLHFMFPYSQYHALFDERTRRTHKVMHGFVALRSWEGWSIIRPRNGYNCRCYLTHHTLLEAINLGWATRAGRPRFLYRFPNSASQRNFNAGTFPDPNWFGPKLVTV